MRIILAFTLAVFTAVPSVCGQQIDASQQNESGLLASLKSPDGGERLKAFYQLRSSPSAIRNEKIRAALLDLLDREVQDEVTNRKEGEGESEGGDEYIGDLTNTVASFADWTDAREVCLLVAEGALPTDTYAEHARLAIPCILKRARSSFSWNRGPAVALLVEVLANKKTDAKLSTIETCKQVIRTALRDPVDSVRIDTVHALAVFGGKDMIPALRQVTQSDSYTDKENHSFWIREYANQAIQSIQSRTNHY